MTTRASVMIGQTDGSADVTDTFTRTTTSDWGTGQLGTWTKGSTSAPSHVNGSEGVASLEYGSPYVYERFNNKYWSYSSLTTGDYVIVAGPSSSVNTEYWVKPPFDVYFDIYVPGLTATLLTDLDVTISSAGDPPDHNNPYGTYQCYIWIQSTETGVYFRSNTEMYFADLGRNWVFQNYTVSAYPVSGWLTVHAHITYKGIYTRAWETGTTEPTSWMGWATNDWDLGAGGDADKYNVIRLEGYTVNSLTLSRMGSLEHPDGHGYSKTWDYTGIASSPILYGFFGTNESHAWSGGSTPGHSMSIAWPYWGWDPDIPACQAQSANTVSWQDENYEWFVVQGNPITTDFPPGKVATVTLHGEVRVGAGGRRLVDGSAVSGSANVEIKTYSYGTTEPGASGGGSWDAPAVGEIAGGSTVWSGSLSYNPTSAWMPFSVTITGLPPNNMFQWGVVISNAWSEMVGWGRLQGSFMLPTGGGISVGFQNLGVSFTFEETFVAPAPVFGELKTDNVRVESGGDVSAMIATGKRG